GTAGTAGSQGRVTPGGGSGPRDASARTRERFAAGAGLCPGEAPKQEATMDPARAMAAPETLDRSGRPQGGGPRGNPGVPRAERRVNAPRPALVEAHADGAPRRVNRQGIAVVREEWRVVDRWWTEEPVQRRYFEVVLESGQNTVVFRDDQQGQWFSQR